MKNLWPICLLLLVLACGQYPRDAEDSLARIQHGTLRVGISHNPPFTIIHDSTYTGSEVELIKAFAAKHNAQIQWLHESETDLAKKLKHFQLDLVVCGLVKESPIVAELGITQAYMEDSSGKHIIAVAPGENALLTDLDGFLESYRQK